MKTKAIVIVAIFLTGCAAKYPVTSFYIKNTSDKIINFKVSVVKPTSTGPFEMTLPFRVFPKDSVLGRKVGMKEGTLPTTWFSRFIIFPIDSVSFNDANNPENWIRSIDNKGHIVYTFSITK